MPERPRRATAKLAGRHLYAGPLFGIFGHDLVELPGRLWPLLDAGERFDGIVVQKFTPGVDGVQLRLDQTIATVLAAFDIGFERIHLVEAPTEVEDLLVPEPALHINHFGLPVLGDCFRRIAARHAGLSPRLPGRGLYLSRTGIGGTGASRVANEPEVEAAARRAGLQVLHPQRLGLPLQIALMAEAGAIAGTDGSALHLAAFARPGTRLLSSTPATWSTSASSTPSPASTPARSRSLRAARSRGSTHTSRRWSCKAGAGRRPGPSLQATGSGAAWKRTPSLSERSVRPRSTA